MSIYFARHGEHMWEAAIGIDLRDRARIERAGDKDFIATLLVKGRKPLQNGFNTRREAAAWLIPGSHAFTFGRDILPKDQWR